MSDLVGWETGADMNDLIRTKYLRDLRRQMVQQFETDELRTLALDLLVDWEDSSGARKSSGCHALIRRVALDGRLDDLLTLLQEERPEVEWTAIPPAQQQILDIQMTIPDGQRQRALEEFLQKMERDVVGQRMATGDFESATQATARAFAQAALPQLDRPRLIIAVRFLADIQLSNVIDLADADLSEADLKGVDLSHAVLRRANLQHTNLEQADLHQANLFAADLRGSILRHADLRQADLRQADLSGASMGGVNLSGAMLKGITLPGRYNAWLQTRLSQMSKTTE